eukprot:2230025-Rhodomonas_salina.2
MGPHTAAYTYDTHLDCQADASFCHEAQVYATLDSAVGSAEQDDGEEDEEEEEDESPTTSGAHASGARARNVMPLAVGAVAGALLAALRP